MDRRRLSAKYIREKISEGWGFIRFETEDQLPREVLEKRIKEVCFKHPSTAESVIRELKANDKKMEKRQKSMAKKAEAAKEDVVVDGGLGRVNTSEHLKELREREVKLASEIEICCSEINRLNNKANRQQGTLKALSKEVSELETLYLRKNQELEDKRRENNQIKTEAENELFKKEELEEELSLVQSEIAMLLTVTISVSEVDGINSNPDIVLDFSGYEDVYQGLMIDVLDRFEDFRIRDVKLLAQVICASKSLAPSKVKVESKIKGFVEAYKEFKDK